MSSQWRFQESRVRLINDFDDDEVEAMTTPATRRYSQQLEAEMRRLPRLASPVPVHPHTHVGASPPSRSPNPPPSLIQQSLRLRLQQGLPLLPITQLTGHPQPPAAASGTALHLGSPNIQLHGSNLIPHHPWPASTLLQYPSNNQHSPGRQSPQGQPLRSNTLGGFDPAAGFSPASGSVAALQLGGSPHVIPPLNGSNFVPHHSFEQPANYQHSWIHQPPQAYPCAQLGGVDPAAVRLSPALLGSPVATPQVHGSNSTPCWPHSYSASPPSDASSAAQSTVPADSTPTPFRDEAEEEEDMIPQTAGSAHQGQTPVPKVKRRRRRRAAGVQASSSGKYIELNERQFWAWIRSLPRCVPSPQLPEDESKIGLPQPATGPVEPASPADQDSAAAAAGGFQGRSSKQSHQRKSSKPQYIVHYVAHPSLYAPALLQCRVLGGIVAMGLQTAADFDAVGGGNHQVEQEITLNGVSVASMRMTLGMFSSFATDRTGAIKPRDPQGITLREYADVSILTATPNAASTDPDKPLQIILTIGPADHRVTCTSHAVGQGEWVWTYHLIYVDPAIDPRSIGISDLNSLCSSHQRAWDANRAPHGKCVQKAGFRVRQIVYQKQQAGAGPASDVAASSAAAAQSSSAAAAAASQSSFSDGFLPISTHDYSVPLYGPLTVPKPKQSENGAAMSDSLAAAAADTPRSNASSKRCASESNLSSDVDEGAAAAAAHQSPSSADRRRIKHKRSGGQQSGSSSASTMELESSSAECSEFDLSSCPRQQQIPSAVLQSSVTSAPPSPPAAAAASAAPRCSSVLSPPSNGRFFLNQLTGSPTFNDPHTRQQQQQQQQMQQRQMQQQQQQLHMQLQSQRPAPSVLELHDSVSELLALQQKYLNEQAYERLTSSVMESRQHEQQQQQALGASMPPTPMMDAAAEMPPGVVQQPQWHGF